MGKARLDNPGHQSKTEEEHIAHVKERAKQRFDLDMSTDDYYELLDLVLNNESKHLYRINNTNSVQAVKFKGKDMLVVFGCSNENKGDRLPSRIKTVLYTDAEYPVPDELIRQGMERKEFTKQIKEVISEMVAFAKDVMPRITPRELYTNPKYDNLSNGFKKMVKHLSSGIKPVRAEAMLSMAFKLVIEKYDKNIVEETE